MAYSKYKRSGWFKESQRHSLAARGVKTGKRVIGSVFGGITKASSSVASSFSAKGKGKIYLNKHNWSWEETGDGKAKFSLGNMTDAGWYWTGDENDAVGFMNRIDRSKVREEFLQEMKSKGIGFSEMKKLLKKSAEKGDGLYEMSGDNQLWHFGNDGEPEVEIFQEENIDKEMQDKFYREYDGIDFDEFDKEYGAEYKKDIVAAVDKSNSYDDFFKNIENVRQGALEESVSYQNRKVYETLNKIKSEQPKDKFKEAGEHPSQKKLSAKGTLFTPTEAKAYKQLRKKLDKDDDDALKETMKYMKRYKN